MTTTLNLIAVASGGALGALSRHGLSTLLTRHVLSQPHWAILSVNLVGCFVIGFLSALFLQWRIGETWALLAVTGFLGSFTTYSTFALQSLNLLQTQQWTHLSLYLGTHFIGGMALCLLGMVCAKP